MNPREGSTSQRSDTGSLALKTIRLQMTIDNIVRAAHLRALFESGLAKAGSINTNVQTEARPEKSAFMKNMSQLPPFVSAIQYNNFELAKRLLDEGMDPNTNHNNQAILIYAIRQDNFEIAKLLVDTGANTCGQYPDSSPLYFAIKRAKIPIIQLLVENGANFLLHEALITAINQVSLKIVAELIELGADADSPNSHSEYPILCAVRRMNFPIVKLLVEKRADLNRRQEQETALSISLKNDDFRTFQLLIESGADPELAREAIEEKMKTNPSLTAYMSKTQKKFFESLSASGLSGQEAASE